MSICQTIVAFGEPEIFPAFLYIYVDDADGTYRRALAAGAVSIEEPWDTPYGDRRAPMAATTPATASIGTSGEVSSGSARGLQQCATHPTGRRVGMGEIAAALV